MGMAIRTNQMRMTSDPNQTLAHRCRHSQCQPNLIWLSPDYGIGQRSKDPQHKLRLEEFNVLPGALKCLQLSPVAALLDLAYKNSCGFYFLLY